MAFRALSSLLVSASLLTMQTSAAILTGESFTSMYYDCCKPACAWPTQGRFISGLRTCDANNQYVLDDTAGNYCGGGPASSCIDQTPWAVNDSFSFGYASIFIRGADSTEWCCSCYALEFLDSDIKGKKMIVQGINVNYNEDQINWFSLTVPGQADWQGMCEQRFGGTFGEFFGVNATGLTNVTQCDNVPQPLQAACKWRYTWYKNAKGPNATFTRVQCPAELTKVSGCLRADDKTFNAVAAEATPALMTTRISSPLVVFTTVVLLFVALPELFGLF
ncbi:Endoglucanase-5 [Orbilia brochopaga]|nr:Endoglucanase-5 [Drechslerella brochopaga]